MSERDPERIDGPVNSDVSAFRDTDYTIHYGARSGVTCHRCGRGEVWQPMQTMDMPMYLRCLVCGMSAPSGDFDNP